MTLDEAIKHCEEVAKQNRELFELIGISSYDEDNYNCLECAKAHEQLAEWLKELKQLKEQTDTLDKIRAEILDIDCGQYCENPLTASEVREMVLEIIDAYKAESEAQDADSN